MCRYRSRLLFLLELLLILALALPAVAGAWTPWATTKLIAGYSSFIPAQRSYWNNPAVSGNIVVWERWDETQSDADVIAYDMRTGKTKRCSTTSTGRQLRPEISGNWVVYQDLRNAGSEIYAYNIATDTEVRVTNDAIGQQLPDIWGARVVYEQNGGKVFLYDLATKKTTELAASVSNKHDAAIFGDRVAFCAGSDVAYVDLKDKSVHTVVTGGGLKYNTEVSDGWVAWQQVASPWDMRAQNLSSGQTVEINTGGASRMPEISGSRLVWYEGEVPGPQHVWLYDLAAQARVQLSSGDAYSYRREAAIWGNNVVWTDSDDTADGHGDRITLAALRAPTLAISVNGPLGYGGIGKVSGRLAVDGVAKGGVTITIEKSTDDGRTWSKAADVKTQDDGAFSASFALYRSTLFRAQYAGSKGLFGALTELSATSAYKKLQVSVALGKPSGPTRKAEDTSFTVRGSLKPRHKSGTKPVQIQVYKKSSGKWRLMKTYAASAYDYDTYSRYKAKIKLTSPGKWRIRAYYPTSATNYQKYSSYRDITAY